MSDERKQTKSDINEEQEIAILKRLYQRRNMFRLFKEHSSNNSDVVRLILRKGKFWTDDVLLWDENYEIWDKLGIKTESLGVQIDKEQIETQLTNQFGQYQFGKSEQKAVEHLEGEGFFVSDPQCASFEKRGSLILPEKFDSRLWFCIDSMLHDFLVLRHEVFCQPHYNTQLSRRSMNMSLWQDPEYHRANLRAESAGQLHKIRQSFEENVWFLTKYRQRAKRDDAGLSVVPPVTERTAKLRELGCFAVSKAVTAPLTRAIFRFDDLRSRWLSDYGGLSDEIMGYIFEAFRTATRLAFFDQGNIAKSIYERRLRAKREIRENKAVVEGLGPTDEYD